MHTIGNFSFVPFATIELLLLIFLYAFLPETKGMPVEDVAQEMRAGARRRKYGLKSLSMYIALVPCPHHRISEGRRHTRRRGRWRLN